MKSVLFVDDEPNVLEGFRASLRKERKRWEVATAPRSEAALLELRAAPFDVIVSDIRMPGMDGATLLRRVKDEFPGVVRILLSADAERDAVVRGLPVSHQFLSKPCDTRTLAGVLQRVRDLHDLLPDDSLRSVAGRFEWLPCLPQAHETLTRALLESDVSVADVTKIVEHDPALCAKVLQVANSSYFGLAQPVNVGHALGDLGVELVRTLALTAQVFRPLDGTSTPSAFSLDVLQRHCVVTARVARQLLVDPKQQAEAFTAALLHDIGMVVLALGVPDRLAGITAAFEADGQPMHVAERSVLGGVTHAEVGAYLLGLWGLPSGVVEAVAHHHSRSYAVQRGFGTAAAVQIADALVGAHMPAMAGVPEQEPLDPDYVAALGIAAKLPAWTALAADEAAKWNFAARLDS